MTAPLRYLIPILATAATSFAAESGLPKIPFLNLPVGTAKSTAQPPLLDGDVMDVCWQAGTSVEIAFQGDARRIDLPATVWFSYDSDNLYMAATVPEAQMHLVRANIPAGQDQENVWNDDFVQLLLAREDTATPAYTIGINANGAFVDAQYRPQYRSFDWTCHPKIKGRKTGDHWSFEAAIPWKGLGTTAPRRGEAWRFNLLKQRAFDQQNASFLPSLGQNERRMAPLIFVDKDMPVRISSILIPEISPKPCAINVTLTNESKRELRLSAQVDFSGKTRIPRSTATAKVPAGSNLTFPATFLLPGEGEYPFVISVMAAESLVCRISDKVVLPSLSAAALTLQMNRTVLSHPRDPLMVRIHSQRADDRRPATIELLRENHVLEAITGKVGRILSIRAPLLDGTYEIRAAVNGPEGKKTVAGQAQWKLHERESPQSTETVREITYYPRVVVFNGRNNFSPASAGGLTVSWTQQSENAKRFEVYEISANHPGTYDNPFWDVRISGMFSHASGKTYQVFGFFDGDSTWRIRFAPPLTGQWTWKLVLDNSRQYGEKKGSFVCDESNREGFLRVDSTSPTSLSDSRGRPYYPLGVQTCGIPFPAMDGLSREVNSNVTVDAYAKKFASAGANFFRHTVSTGSQDYCATPILNVTTRQLDQYDLQQCRILDKAAAEFHKAGFHQLFSMIQTTDWLNATSAFDAIAPNAHLDVSNRPAMEYVKRYLAYFVARWGAWADVWEFFNEEHAPIAWYEEMAAWVRSQDPYGHLLGTSWEQPELTWCDVNTPHYYMSPRYGETDQDLEVAGEATRQTRFGKPVVFGEFGHYGKSDSPEKFRTGIWVMLMHGVGVTFWDMSFDTSTSGNAYLGPTARNYFRIFRDFTLTLDRDLKPAAVKLMPAEKARAYGMTGPNGLAAYIHAADWSSPAKGIRLGLPTNLANRLVEAIFTDPKTGKVVGRLRQKTGTVLDVPAFEGDIAAKVTLLN